MFVPQGDKIRDMKAAGAADIDIKKEVLDLKARRKVLFSRLLKYITKFFL